MKCYLLADGHNLNGCKWAQIQETNKTEENIAGYDLGSVVVPLGSAQNLGKNTLVPISGMADSISLVF